MWTCPKCQRLFKSNNQSHICVKKDIGELFIDRPDHMVLAFDFIRSVVMKWQPNSLGASQNTVVFTNHKAWLIVRPMAKELDLKFYYGEELDSEVLKKVVFSHGKYAHHIRIKEEFEASEEVLYLLKKGFEYGLE